MAEKIINFNAQQLKSYDIIIKNGIFKDIPKLLNIDSINKFLIITDSNVENIYGKKLQQLFIDNGKECNLISFVAGEKSKNLNTFSEIHEKIKLRLDRNSCVITLGGGVTGDLAGFVASTYMRGIKFIRIPTSLLAMVDSSVGGKLGLNTSIGKNCIGVFNNPYRVYIDPLLLKTLPEKYFKDGLGEIIKHAIIGSQKLFDFIQENTQKILNLNPSTLTNLIFESLKIKTEIVEKDELESGKRMKLNLGHTIGHAIEEEVGYGNITHGFAISLGIIAAAFISLNMDYITSKIFYSIIKIVKSCGLPTNLKDLNLRVNSEKILKLIKHDKKNIDNKIRYVLIKRIGCVFITDEIKEKQLLEGLKIIF